MTDRKYKTGDFVKIYGVPGRCKIIDVDESETPDCYLIHPPAHAFMSDRWWSDEDIEGIAP